MQKRILDRAFDFARACALLTPILAVAQIEEVIVTAQKRAQNLQQVAIAVTAFTEEDLKNTGATSLEQLTDFVVGAELYDDRSAGQPTWVIRGVGLADYNANNTPTAAVYYDEFYLASNAFGGIGLYDIERVEVLKGPQGGLYGRNTSGGAVRLVSRSPEIGEEFTGSINLSYDSLDKRSAQATVGFEITPNFAVRIAATSEQGGGWQDTLMTPEDDGHGDRDFMAAKFGALYQINDSSELLLKIEVGKDHSETPLAYGRAMYNEDQSFCDATLNEGRYDPASCLTWYNATMFGTTGGADSGIDPALQREDGTTVMGQPINKLKNTFQSANLQYRWENDAIAITLISALIEYDYIQLYDYAGAPLDLAVEDSLAELRSYSHELRVQSNGTGRLVWLLGAMMGRDTDKEERFFDARDNVFIVPISADRGFFQEADSKSVYGQFEWDLFEQLKLNTSIRYTKEEKNLSDAYFRKGEVGGIPDSAPMAVHDAINAAIGVALGFPDYENSSRSVDLEKRWSGHVGLDYFVMDDVMLYGKITSGFKSGGFFGGFALAEDMLDPYTEERVLAYEIGVKSTLLDKTLRLNAAAFFYDYEDIQAYANRFNESTGTAIIYLDNAGDGEYEGFELEVQWRPQFLPGFEAVLGAAWLDAVVSDSDEEATASDGSTVRLEGQHIPNAPEFSYMVSLSYERPIFGDLMLGGNLIYSWRDDIFSERHAPTNVDLAGVGISDYGLLSARFFLRPVDGAWSIDINGSNVADEEYWTNATTDGLGSFISTAGKPGVWSIAYSYFW